MTGYYPDPPPEAVGLAQPGPDDVDEFRAVEESARRLGFAYGLRVAAWKAAEHAAESLLVHEAAKDTADSSTADIALGWWSAERQLADELRDMADAAQSYDDNRPRPYGDEP